MVMSTKNHYLQVQLDEERAAFHAAQVAEREAREECVELRAEVERLRNQVLAEADRANRFQASLDAVRAERDLLQRRYEHALLDLAKYECR